MARTGRPRGASINGHHAWSDEEIAFLRAWRPHGTMPDLTSRLNKAFGLTLSVTSVDGTCKRYNIRSGRNGQFRSGQKPWNKGIKGYTTGGRSFEARCPAGHRPHNWVPVGTRIKEQDGYWKVKVRDDSGVGRTRLDWVHEHRQTWEAAHGPQPKGTAIIFIDGNTDNLTLDNLACVTRSELARLNQLNWRNLRGNEARKALIAEVKLLALAHRRARDLGMNWGERRRLIPQRPKIAASDLMEAAHG